MIEATGFGSLEVFWGFGVVKSFCLVRWFACLFFREGKNELEK